MLAPMTRSAVSTIVVGDRGPALRFRVGSAGASTQAAVQYRRSACMLSNCELKRWRHSFAKVPFFRRSVETHTALAGLASLPCDMAHCGQMACSFVTSSTGQVHAGAPMLRCAAAQGHCSALQPVSCCEQCARERTCADGDAYTRLDVRGLAEGSAVDMTPWHSRSLRKHSHCSGAHNESGRRACSGGHIAHGPTLCDALWGLPGGGCCVRAPPGRLQQVQVRRPCAPQNPTKNPNLNLSPDLGACSRCECGVHARRSTGARPSCASCGG